MALVGYARVSTASQELAPQLDELTAAGCIRIFSEVVSSTAAVRPQLDAVLDYLREGDILVMVAVDRLSRRMIQFLTIVDSLRQRGIEVRSLSQGFDTTTPEGRLMMSFYASFAELERDQISRRTIAGLDAARARGSVVGRPVVLTPERLEAIADARARETPVSQIAKALKISPRSVQRGVAELRSRGLIG